MYEIETTSRDDSVVIEIVSTKTGELDADEVFEELDRLINHSRMTDDFTVPTSPLQELNRHAWINFKEPRFARWPNAKSFTPDRLVSKLNEAAKKLRHRNLNPAGRIRIKIRIPAEGDATTPDSHPLDGSLEFRVYERPDGSPSLAISYQTGRGGTVVDAEQAADAFIDSHTDDDTVEAAVADGTAVLFANTRSESNNATTTITTESIDADSSEEHPIKTALDHTQSAFDNGTLESTGDMAIELQIR